MHAGRNALTAPSVHETFAPSATVPSRSASRYCARNPLALGRLTYDLATERLT